MNKVLIIEPHGDDALCSCSSIMRDKNNLVTVLTLSERPSDKLKNHYDNIENTIFLDLNDLNYGRRPKVSTHDIHRKYLNNEDVYNLYKNLVIETFEEYKDTKEIIKESIKSYLLSDIYEYVVFPLGLCHPYHIVVAESIKELIEDNNLLKRKKFCLYVDKPYIQNRYVKEMYEFYKSSHNMDKINHDYDGREEEILKVLKDVYPTEVNMLRFSSDILLRTSDTILEFC